MLQNLRRLFNVNSNNVTFTKLSRLLLVRILFYIYLSILFNYNRYWLSFLLKKLEIDLLEYILHNIYFTNADNHSEYT